MKKKYKILIIICLLIVVGLILIYFGLSTKKDTQKEINHKDKVEKIVDNNFFNEDTTLESLNKVTGNIFSPSDIVIGKDSIMRDKPKDSVIKQYNLNEYEQIVNEYASIVEKRFKDNLKYYYIENKNGTVSYTITPWYFYNYSSDLLSLTSKILETTNYDISNIEKNYDEYLSYEYKAKAIALKIMNNYLENYDNKEQEEVYLRLLFKGDNLDKNMLYSLYLNMTGATSKYSMLKNEEVRNSQEDRITTYLNESINNGLVNKNNLLKI